MAMKPLYRLRRNAARPWPVVIAVVLVLTFVPSYASIGTKPAPIEPRMPQPSISLWSGSW